MYVRAKQLREHGRRRTDHEIAADPGQVGTLTFYVVGASTQLNLNDPGSSVSAPLYPVLHEARLVALHSNSMLFKGEERPAGNAAIAYVQEWSVRLEHRDETINRSRG